MRKYREIDTHLYENEIALDIKGKYNYYPVSNAGISSLAEL
jgi:hypothetical protein